MVAELKLIFELVAVRLLHVANSNPPTNAALRGQFYDFKAKLLRRYAWHLAPDQIQVITHECWGTWSEKCGPRCLKCGGSGIFDQFGIELRHYKWRGFTFHTPRTGRVHDASRWEDVSEALVIHGKIQHRPVSRRRAAWSRLALYFLFNRPQALWIEVTNSQRWLGASYRLERYRSRLRRHLARIFGGAESEDLPF